MVRVVENYYYVVQYGSGGRAGEGDENKKQ